MNESCARVSPHLSVSGSALVSLSPRLSLCVSLSVSVRLPVCQSVAPRLSLQWPASVPPVSVRPPPVSQWLCPCLRPVSVCVCVGVCFGISACPRGCLAVGPGAPLSVAARRSLSLWLSLCFWRSLLVSRCLSPASALAPPSAAAACDATLPAVAPFRKTGREQPTVAPPCAFQAGSPLQRRSARKPKLHTRPLSRARRFPKRRAHLDPLRKTSRQTKRRANRVEAKPSSNSPRKGEAERRLRQHRPQTTIAAAAPRVWRIFCERVPASLQRRLSGIPAAKARDRHRERPAQPLADKGAKWGDRSRSG